VFCSLTEQAVRDFQTARGMPAIGRCDEHTWAALVEATWAFGDRILVLTSPNMRGDDVAELQSRLARLGFDAGRVDGIFGPDTARALEAFQANCGLVSDGVCGAGTVRVLVRVSSQTGTGPGVTAIRERELLRTGLGSLARCRVVVGHFGGLGALTRSLARELRVRGATVMSLDEPDAVAQALAANHFGADVYLGFETTPEPAAVVHFYRVPTFESAGGRALAEALAARCADAVGVAATTQGMRLPVLRETRMPAIVATLGPVRTVTDRSPQLVQQVVAALELWVSRAD
jgi:N-acetylmuramoyl-L-alanine amidase